MMPQNALGSMSLQLIGRVLVYMGAFGTAGIRFGARLGWSRIARQPCHWHALLGHTLAELCEALGPTYIKCGQLLSTRVDLIPPAVLQPLARLQDEVAPFASRRVWAILAAQYGCSAHAVFATFDPVPISSASVACVYRATLQNGQLVAVKIRRPNVVRTVRNDLRLMRATARLLVKLPALRTVPMLHVIHELGAAIEQQLDFRREAAHNRRFRAYFAQNHHVRIPALVDAYCTDAVLVMEFMPDLVRIDARTTTGIEYQDSMVNALHALYQMIFVDGFIHCDLHPGNLFFHAAGDVTLLDLGFVKEFSEDERVLFAKFFFNIATNGGKQCATIMYDTALSVPPTLDYAEFERTVSNLIARATGVRAADFQVAAFGAQLFDIQRRFRIRAAPNFVMAMLALLVFEGIVKRHYADLDFQREAQPFLLQALFPPRPRRTSATTPEVA